MQINIHQKNGSQQGGNGFSSTQWEFVMAAPPTTAARKYQPIHISSTNSNYVRNVIWKIAR